MGENKKVAQAKELLRSKPARRVGLALGAVLIFAVGIGVGDGSLHFGSGYGPVASGLPNRLDYSSVNAVYQQLKDNYDGQLTEAQLLDGMKAGLAEASKDPYTEYFTAAQAKDFNSQLNQSFSGIGAELGKDKSDNLIVVSPIAGFPADKAGLKSQDIIATINGSSTSGMSVDEAVSKIRGKAGSQVKLGIIRAGTQLDLAITRQNITVPSVSHQMLAGDIGYIRITTFADDTSGLMTKAAADLKQQGAKSIILDLRGNPGGLLQAAVDVSSEWLAQDTTILQEKRGSTVIETYKATGADALHGLPTVVLVDQGSASASEITAGALHDNKAATIIGEKTYGKGVVQQLLNLKGGAQLKVTIASWYRPDGQNINKKGITPDQTVKLTDGDVTAGNDTQKTAAIDYLTSH